MTALPKAKGAGERNAGAPGTTDKAVTRPEAPLSKAVETGTAQPRFAPNPRGRASLP
jgi:hypothetical protein